jgi:hypothetical protein
MAVSKEIFAMKNIIKTITSELNFTPIETPKFKESC